MPEKQYFEGIDIVSGGTVISSADVADTGARASLEELEDYVESIAPVALSVTENGTYTAPTGVFGYSPVTVTVNKDFYPKAHATLDDASRVEGDDMRVYPMGGTDYYPYVYLGAMPYPVQQGDDFEPCGKYFAGQTQEHTVTTFLDLIDVATGESVSGYPQRVAPNWSVSIVDGGYMKIVSWTVKASGAVSVTTERYNPTYTKPLQDTKDSAAVTGGKLDGYVDASYYIDGGAGESVLLQSLTATANGTYTAPARTAYNEVNVNVPRDDIPWITRSLTSVTIPDSVTEIGQYAFAGMDDLQSVNVPSSVDHIYNGAFMWSGVSNVTLPENVNLYLSESVFEKCYNLESITLPSDLRGIPNRAFYGSSLLSIFIPQSVYSVGNSAFEDSPLQTLTFEAGEKRVNCTARAFAKTDLESVAFPANVRVIGRECFAECYSLQSVTIGSGIEVISTDAFVDCDNLSTITINKAEGSITGAPWGATNATVVWTG